MKAIAAVLLASLILPTTAWGQETTGGAREGGIVRASARSPDDLRQSIAREGAKLAEFPVTNGLQAQQSPQRTWAGRHPVALGAMVGAAGGAVWGAAACSGTCYGSDGQTTQLWMAIGAGIGAAIGTGVGAIVSLARRR